MKLKALLILVLTVLPPVAGAQAWEEDFVYVEGTKLMLNGEEFYFSAANSYEMLYGPEAVDDIIAQAQLLGVNVIRMWGFWNDEDAAGALQREPGVFPEENWKKFDYVLWKAEQAGIRLIIPLVNYWPEFGGIDYYRRNSPTAGQNEDFYTDEPTIQLYKNYIDFVLNRENTYKNGLKYMDDPTVMIWELMNEPRGRNDVSGDMVAQWLNDMAKYIHDQDPERKHLVGTGEEGFLKDYGSSFDLPNEGSYFPQNSASPEIDVLGFHLWPINWSKQNEAEAFIEEWISIHKIIADEIGKPVYMGEFGWQINRTPQYSLARRDEIYQWTYDKSLEYGLAGAGFWVLEANHDVDRLTGGNLRFPVVVPEDASTTAIIQEFSENITTLYTTVAKFGSSFDDVTPGASAELSWTTRRAESVTINGEPVAATGSMVVTPDASTTYVLEAYGQIENGVWGTVTETLTVTVSPPKASSIVVSSNSLNLAFGERTTLDAQVLDQVGNPFSIDLTWSVNGGGVMSEGTGPSSTFISDGAKGNFIVDASFNGLSMPTVVEVGGKSVNDDELTFVGDWTKSTGSGKYLEDDHYSAEPGATYELTFFGAGVSIVAPKAPHHGVGWVAIDGGPEEMANFGSLAPEPSAQIWESGPLDVGLHTLTLRVGDVGVVVADRFEIDSGASVADIDDDFFDYEGAWTRSPGNPKFMKFNHFTTEAGATFKTQFLGTKVQFFGAGVSWLGKGVISFNGEDYPVDFSSEEPQAQALHWESPEVDFGLYDVTMTADGGRIAIADRMTVTKLLANEIRNDDAFVFQGDWNPSTGGGKYKGDDQYTAQAGASFEISFSGSSVKLYGPVASHHGTATVYINGENVGTADFSRDLRVDNTFIWQSGELPNSNHTLRVVANGDGVIVADRAEIFAVGPVVDPVPDPQQPLYLEAEDAQVSAGLQSQSSFGNYTGTGYITGFDSSGEDLTWEFTVTETRAYTLKFRYAAGYGTKYNSVYINDVKDSVQEFSATADFSTWADKAITRTLSAGTHRVSIRMDGSSWGWMNVDALSVE